MAATRKPLSVITAALVVVGLAAPAAAQPMTHLPRRLTDGDMAILKAEAAKLGPNGPKEGTWHNRKSANSGVVTFLGASERTGLPCRSLRYTFRTGTPQDGMPYKLTWCQLHDGEWKIAP